MVSRKSPPFTEAPATSSRETRSVTLRSATPASSDTEPTGKKQRYSWPGTSPVSGGSSCRQLSWAYRQRAANLQPCGGLVRSGGMPGML